MRRIAAAVLLLAFTAGCELFEDGSPVGPSGTSDDTFAPASVIGRTLTADADWTDSPCENPVTATFRFVDSSTIHGINSTGEFDYNTTRWSYTRTGDRTAEIYMEWENGVATEYDLTFTSETSGTFEGRGFILPSWADGRRSLCSGRLVEEARTRGTFRID